MNFVLKENVILIRFFLSPEKKMKKGEKIYQNFVWHKWQSSRKTTFKIWKSLIFSIGFLVKVKQIRI